MKAATFNVNSLRARLPIVLDWLRKESPDILCLQETKVPDGAFPEEDFSRSGYTAVYSGEKSYNGVAIISKGPPERVIKGFDGVWGLTRLLTVLYRGIPVVNTYVPQGVAPLSDRFREKLDWLEALYDFFDRHFSPRKPLLWLGDFNIAPGPEDVYDPVRLSGSVGFHPDEHAALERFKRWGFVDVVKRFLRGGGHYSFWDYRIRNAVKKGIGWRVDHIWATRPLADLATGAWIDLEPRLAPRPSDHTVVVAEFSL